MGVRLRTFFLLFAVLSNSLLCASDSIQDCLRPVPNAGKFKGKLAKYLLNGLYVHTYESIEGYGDWSIILENEKAVVVLECQSMPDSARELHRYLGSLNKPIAGVLISYHGVGPDSFPGVPMYATPEAIDYIKSNEMEEVIAEYARKFPQVDPKIVIPTHRLDKPCFSVGGIEMCLQPSDTGLNSGSIGRLQMPSYCLSFPEHNIYYMHVLSGDSHVIINSLEEINPYIEYLRELRDKGFEVFLSAHHMPETLKQLEAKIHYLELVKMVASVASTRDEFVSEIQRLDPTRKGEAFLQTTADNLYP